MVINLKKIITNHTRIEVVNNSNLNIIFNIIYGKHLIFIVNSFRGNISFSIRNRICVVNELFFSVMLSVKLTKHVITYFEEMSGNIVIYTIKIN